MFTFAACVNQRGWMENGNSSMKWMNDCHSTFLSDLQQKERERDSHRHLFTEILSPPGSSKFIKGSSLDFKIYSIATQCLISRFQEILPSVSLHSFRAKGLSQINELFSHLWNRKQRNNESGNGIENRHISWTSPVVVESFVVQLRRVSDKAEEEKILQARKRPITPI